MTSLFVKPTTVQKKEYCLIGLNKFNLEVGKVLVNDGHKVTVIDNDDKKINDYGDNFNYSIVCDATSLKEIKQVGLNVFDYVVVGITDISTSIAIVANLKELNIQNILCKAKNESHKRILKFLGIKTTYIPEEEIALKISYKLVHDLNVSSLSINSDNMDTLLLRINLTNEKLYKKRIQDFEFVKNSTIISIKRKTGQIVFPVRGTDILLEEDLILFLRA